jgi:hypothetical protein
MDIIKELKEFEFSADFGDGLIQELKVKEEEARKKRYLIRVMSITKKFENLMSTDFFKNAGIEFIRFELDLIPRRVGDKVYTFNSEFFDKDRNIISSYIDKEQGIITNEAGCVNKLFQTFILHEGLPPDLVSSEIYDGSKHTLDLKADVNEEMLKLFLSQELKQIYDYSKMNMELPHNDIKGGKKLKV